MALTHQNEFSYDELISCAKGELFGPGNPQLPLPPMLMTDRITRITETGEPMRRAISKLNWILPLIYGSFPVISREIR